MRREPEERDLRKMGQDINGREEGDSHGENVESVLNKTTPIPVKRLIYFLEQVLLAV